MQNNLDNQLNLTEFTATYFMTDGSKQQPLDCVTIWATNIAHAHEIASEVANDEMKPFCSKHKLALCEFMTLEEAQ